MTDIWLGADGASRCRARRAQGGGAPPPGLLVLARSLPLYHRPGMRPTLVGIWCAGRAGSIVCQLARLQHNCAASAEGHEARWSMRFRRGSCHPYMRLVTVACCTPPATVPPSLRESRRLGAVHLLRIDTAPALDYAHLGDRTNRAQPRALRRLELSVGCLSVSARKGNQWHSNFSQSRSSPTPLTRTSPPAGEPLG